MDYKEKYENLVEAVKKLQEVNPSNEGIQNWINDNIPELKENGDEKIKKALIEHFAGAHSSMYPYKGFTKEQILAWIEKQGQQDKVKPKFHKGEWIVFNGLTLYIGEDKSFYGTTTKDGINNSYDWDIDNVARLWTIKDAKDGDILYAKICDEEWLYLYNNLIDDPDFLGLLEKSWINNYCCYRQNDGWFSYEKQEAYPVNEYSIISPATKEQRDRLKKAMTDAGYTFDFEKKELKKIEQKPTEWSEEDEKMRASIIFTLAGFMGNEDKIDWLKSLKDRCTWKPSDKQLEALKEACDEHWEPDGLDPLYTLYQELKKTI